TVLSGGVERVRGVTSGAVVVSSGSLVVLSGGKASGGTIHGGLIEVASGGTASGTVSFVSGGTLRLDATTGFTGKLNGFAIPDRIDLRGVAFGSSTARKFVEASGNTSGTLTVTDGTHTVHLTLLGSYTTSNFKLASDGKGGTLVTDPPAASGLSLLYKGFNYVDYYNQEYSDNNTLPAVAGTGANGAALTPDWGIDVAESSIYAGGETTDTTNLGTAIREANQNGMTAFVRPLIDFLYNQKSTNGPINFNPGDYYVPPGPVDLRNLPTGEPDANGGTIPTTQNGTVPPGVGTDAYRGFLNPADINVPVFFGSPTTPGSYDYMIVSQAKTAAANGATLFSVGTELDSLADNAAYTTYWDNLIADVRAAAPSLKLTFSANWATASQVTFWNKLDYVGIDGYVPLSNTIPATAAQNPSLASLIAGWNKVSSVTIAYSGGTTVSQTLGGMSAIDAFDQLAKASISNKFIFTEFGYQNDTGAATDPTGGSNQGVTDPSLQAELYTAFFDAWGAAQQTANANGGLFDGIRFPLVGAYIWDWTPDRSNDDWSPGNANNSAALTVIEAGFATPSPPIVVSASHTSSGVNIPKGVTEIVLSGGTARGTIILTGGTETVSAGGKDFNAKISGKQFVHGGATSATVAAGGNQYVDAGGTASATIVHSGGRQIVSAGGVASGSTVSSGGSLIVSAGGTVSSGRVNNGGTETVYGRASGGTINGGIVHVASGGTATGTVTFVTGGTLQLDAGAGFTGVIKGFGKPDLLDRIDLRGIGFGVGTTKSFKEAAGGTSGTLTVTDGTHTVHLTLLGFYSTGNFTLATDNHGGTRVTDPPLAAGASPMTFEDIALARLPSGAASPGNLPNYFRQGTVGLNELPYAGQTLLATGPPAGPSGGDHHLLLPAPR
ncbi:MAG: AIDA repeat-containing protein, partial [Stellaceae bacterium]